MDAGFHTSGDLHSAFYTYLSLVQDCFAAARQQQSQPSMGLAIVLSRDTLLQQVVSFVEGQLKFSALVDITGRSFCGGVSPNLIECTRQVQVYFRLSGTYEALFDAQGELDLGETFQRYCEAFQSENDTITHLAPLKWLSLGTKPISCQGFQIRKFSPQELDAILKSVTRRIFFPWASINTELLSQHCLIYAVENVPSLKPGDSVWSRLPPYGRAYPAVRKGRDPQYPAIIESALRCVALYDWDGDYHRPSDMPNPLAAAALSAMQAAGIEWGDSVREPEHATHTQRMARSRSKWAEPIPIEESDFWEPRCPFVLSISSSLLDRPENAPDLSSLEGEWMEDIFDDPAGLAVVPIPDMDISPDDEMFDAQMGLFSRLLDLLPRNENQWAFLDAALYYLLKAFTAAGTDRLLWNITAIEAMLGEKSDGGLTRLLRSRVSRIVGKTNEARKEAKKHFNELYDLRSDIVHGNARLSVTLHGGHLRNARNFAREVVCWMLRLLAHSADETPDEGAVIPTRELLLLLLDMEAPTRQAIRKLGPLPDEFPYVESWLMKR